MDENGKFLHTKQDLVWLPELDEDFKKFVKELCLDFGWPKGPVTAVCLWNEPWEGTSISGWQADMIRYKEIYSKMADAVIEARLDVGELILSGTFTGQVFAKRRVTVHKGGVLTGTVVSPALVVEEGAIVEGDIHMRTKPQEMSGLPERAEALPEGEE